MLERILKAGSPAKVKLTMEAHQEPDAPSHNVMGEIRGSEKPDEVVVLGGHIDSWDIGQGANDDGSGIMASFEAVALIKKLGLRPKTHHPSRVLGERRERRPQAEGRIAKWWATLRPKHVAAIEMDGGAEKPLGFGFGPFRRKPSARQPRPCPIRRVEIFPRLPPQPSGALRISASCLKALMAAKLAPAAAAPTLLP